MISLKDFLLTETFKNLFSSSDKKKWVDDVWEVLQTSYAPIGGIKGKGFSSKEDMIKNVPFWKVAVKSNKVVAVMMYKDKGGRKTVALGTDGTATGKAQLLDIMKNDLSRSFGEYSGPALKFIKKNLPEWEKYQIQAKDIGKTIGKEVEQTGKYTYRRNLGGVSIDKQAIGTPGLRITRR